MKYNVNVILYLIYITYINFLTKSTSKLLIKDERLKTLLNLFFLPSDKHYVKGTKKSVNKDKM